MLICGDLKPHGEHLRVVGTFGENGTIQPKQKSDGNFQPLIISARGQRSLDIDRRLYQYSRKNEQPNTGCESLQR